jgi:hypothetical protein
MTKRIHIVAFGMALLLATSIVSASAFTTATISRDAQIDVANDANSIIELNPNEEVDGVSTNGTGALTFNLDEGVGLNPNARFTYGKVADASQAFTISLASGVTGSYSPTLRYTLDSDDGNTDDNVVFKLYESGSGNWYSDTGADDTVTEEDSTASLDFSTSSTYYVVVTVNTAGQNDNLSGKLTVSV